ncbi:hypothetical protein [Methylobacterium sp. yr668]|uniref:hypothetical protein n=1 Tax=Methylobacterium sp. yr668 TaxID=1761801 RepID=UPI0008EEB50B|nr:hypothetical protein [Methylobacterium sp. yr668]SFS58692.1 hypothetical protein SAMN04487845_10437 [Methylobacterium sp. yr668]
MTEGKNDRVSPSLKDVAAGEKASRDKFIEGGGPLRQPPDGHLSGGDRPTGIVSEVEGPGLNDPLKGK